MEESEVQITESAAASTTSMVVELAASAASAATSAETSAATSAATPAETSAEISAETSAETLAASSAASPVATSATPSVAPPASPVVDDGDSEDEAEVFETYAPAHVRKLPFKVQPRPHPSPLVETASLQAVSSCAPSFPLHESLGLPAEHGLISDAQLESVVSACEAHSFHLRGQNRRSGFALGDGAGVGKGRQVAAIIADSILRGRQRHIWVSVSADLFQDAKRDLDELLGVDFIPVENLADRSYMKIDSGPDAFVRGVLFCTYATLIAEQKDGGTSRFDQVKKWFQRGSEDSKCKYDGVLILDEAHKAKSAAKGKQSSKTGAVVLRLQDALSEARVVYASATPASSPEELAYMTRLGYWGPGLPFASFPEFKAALDRRGNAAMEILAGDMKRRNQYLARTLSFSQCTYKVAFAPIDDRFQALHATSTALWIELLSLLEDSASITGAKPKKIYSAFWGSFQRYFKIIRL